MGCHPRSAHRFYRAGSGADLVRHFFRIPAHRDARGSGIDAVAGFRGKRVSTGQTGSGTEVKTLGVFEANGVAPDNLETHVHQDYPEAAQALKDGKLDAFAWDATLPGKAIFDLAATPGIKIRLLNTGDAVPKMVTKYGPFYWGQRQCSRQCSLQLSVNGMRSSRRCTRTCT